jgi:hypothetical protein
LPEETFESGAFSRTLLVGHLGVLVWFVGRVCVEALGKGNERDGGGASGGVGAVVKIVKRALSEPSSPPATSAKVLIPDCMY